MISDDGSKLFVDNSFVVNNDGLHGMRNREGQRRYRRGAHSLRLEMFEHGGGAGMLFKYHALHNYLYLGITMDMAMAIGMAIGLAMAMAMGIMARTNEASARTSEKTARTSETNARTIETNARTIETNARTSETNARNH